MFREYLAYLLSALIAMQSVIAMADTHQAHQSSVEHLTFDYDGSRLSENIPPGSTDDAKNYRGSVNTDCQHCCHCHGMGQFFLASTFISHTDIDLTENLSDYLFQYSSLRDSPDNPPPIS